MQPIAHAITSRSTACADISLIEGNKGLYDGLDLDGSNSNAALAKLTGTPVLLVLDARGMTRGIAPLILGYQAFDPDIRIIGVILNQLHREPLGENALFFKIFKVVLQCRINIDQCLCRWASSSRHNSW